MKFKTWNKQDLLGTYEISIKIDGVRCHNDSNFNKYSRNGKVLYNIPDFEGYIAEIFCGSFKETIEKTRTFTKEIVIKSDEIYVLSPVLDKRLVIGTFTNPTADFILNLFYISRHNGHEGLVLKDLTTGIRYKVKSEETYDVKITGIFEGKGKNKGKLGGFITDYGRVGTGLTDSERVLYNDKSMIGQTIEVSCMELTETGKFRHPRFVRLREDK